jgi:hypothetical protein
MLTKLWQAVVPRPLRPKHYLLAKAYRASAGVVSAGPFRGMRYVRRAVGSALCPKILGTYERELHPLIERLVARPWRAIVDVGAGEGYYAVGLALRCPRAAVLAFETDVRGQRLIEEMARLNGVQGRVTVRGKCERADLARGLGEGPRQTLVFCDAEGYELILLDPLRLAGLTDACILVELHDFLVAGIADELRGRFGASHTVEHIQEGTRSARDYPHTDWYIRLFPRRWRQRAVNEGRPARMAWLYLEPRNRT